MEKTMTPASFSGILSKNKETMNEIEKFKDAPITAAKRNLIFIGLIFGSLFVLGLFAAEVIKGIAALVVTVIFGLGLYFGLRILKQADPLIRQKVKNEVLNLMIKEAQKNSVAQLENKVIDDRQRLEAGRKSRDQIGALIQKLEGKINPENKGKELHSRKTSMLEKVKNAYDQVCENLEKAGRANKEFQQKVTEYKDMQEFAQVASKAMEMLSGPDNKALEDMLSLAAFEQIDTEFNGALVAIENQAADIALDQE